MQIVIERCNADPCDHIRIRRADTGKELLLTSRVELREPLTEGDLLGTLKVMVRNAPSTVKTWANLKAWLESKEWG